MKLLTKDIERTLPALRSYESFPAYEVPIAVKFFAPFGSYTWYVIEGEKQGDDYLFFGLVDGHEKELGYFTLSQLEEIEGPLGLKIERDLHYSDHKLSEVM